MTLSFILLSALTLAVAMDAPPFFFVPLGPFAGAAVRMLVPEDR